MFCTMHHAGKISAALRSVSPQTRAALLAAPMRFCLDPEGATREAQSFAELYADAEFLAYLDERQAEAQDRQGVDP